MLRDKRDSAPPQEKLKSAVCPDFANVNISDFATF
jgi:hypothetical protein